MTAQQFAVYQYLSPPQNSFWIWSADGSVVTWLSGRTIAFREEVAALVTNLVTGGLPPLGAILLLRAACRDDWKSMAAEQGNLAEFFTLARRQAEQHPTLFNSAGSFQALTQLSAEAFRRLEGLSALPASQRKGIPALCALAEAFFEGTKEIIDSTTAEAVAVEFAKGVINETIQEFDDDDPFESAVRTLTALTTGAGVPGAEALELRKKTGLDSGVQPAEISIPDAVRRLIGSLTQDVELAGLAKLAHDLLAAVSVPRSLRQAEELPLGGYSDISNRGNLDRLLVTELAHDDLTLAVRVATNEALYMRRERPPAHPPERRALFIDSGIRLWGVPRVFATAVALAFAASAQSRAKIIACRPAQNQLHDVDLSTRTGLITHLAALETAPHPGKSLAPFFKRLESEEDTHTDAIIITHESVLSDIEFQRHLVIPDGTTLLIATVAREGLAGRFHLYQVTRAGRRLLSKATLSLEALIQDYSPKRPLLTHDPRALPVILSLPKLPLLIPCPFIVSRAIAILEYGLFMLTTNGRLLAWRSDDHYAGELLRDIPGGKLLGLFPDPGTDTLYVVILCNSGSVIAQAIQCSTGDLLRNLPFPRQAIPPIAAGLFANVLFLVYPKMVEAIHAHSGATISPVGLSETEWISGRFFRSEHAIETLATNGHALKFEAIRRRANVIHVFERKDVEGLHYVLASGAVVFFETLGTAAEAERVLVLGNNPGLQIVASSLNGAELLATTGQAHYKADLTKRAPSSWNAVANADEAGVIRFGSMARWHKERQLRKNFQHIYVTPEAEIILLSHKGRAAALVVENNVMKMVDRGAMALPEQASTFDRWPEVSRSYDLKVARTRYGNIFLDSRGMLHLVPNDPKKAQFSIVLVPGDTAVWSSSGLTFGPAAFHPAPTENSNDDLRCLVRTFVEEGP